MINILGDLLYTPIPKTELTVIFAFPILKNRLSHQPPTGISLTCARPDNTFMVAKIQNLFVFLSHHSVFYTLFNKNVSNITLYVHN